MPAVQPSAHIAATAATFIRCRPTGSGASGGGRAPPAYSSSPHPTALPEGRCQGVPAPPPPDAGGQSCRRPVSRRPTQLWVARAVAHPSLHGWWPRRQRHVEGDARRPPRWAVAAGTNRANGTVSRPSWRKIQGLPDWAGGGEVKKRGGGGGSESGGEGACKADPPQALGRIIMVPPKVCGGSAAVRYGGRRRVVSTAGHTGWGGYPSATATAMAAAAAARFGSGGHSCGPDTPPPRSALSQHSRLRSGDRPGEAPCDRCAHGVNVAARSRGLLGWRPRGRLGD